MSVVNGGRMPCLYACHGGGPLPLLGQQPSIASFLSSYSKTIPKPKAIVVITAHWITDVSVKVTSAISPSLIFDYSGFPEESYTYTYPAPGSPNLARKICQLLHTRDIACEEDSTRGWDHGVFVPLMLLYPSPTIPVVAMSILSSLSPSQHLAIGAAISSLRDEGVFLLGSGSSFHNFKYFFTPHLKQSGIRYSHEFYEYLKNNLMNKSLSTFEKHQLLIEWSERLPHARECHPLNAEDHLVPLHVIAGAGIGGGGGGGGNECLFLGEASPSDFANANIQWA